MNITIHNTNEYIIYKTIYNKQLIMVTSGAWEDRGITFHLKLTLL